MSKYYKQHLNDWIFHWNPYREKWEGVERDNYKQLFSGGANVLRSSSIATLIEVINKKLHKKL